MIFETHCHLNDEKLVNNIDEIISRAREVGITRFLVVGWDYDSSLLAVKIAEQYDEVYAAVGYHPENIDGVSKELLLKTLELSKNPKVVAIGEIGLDYHWTSDNKEAQKVFFAKQIDYANEHNLPIVIHSRDAINDTLEILKELTPKHNAVLHCYSGSAESMREFLKLGLFIGVDGPLTYRNSITIKQVVEEIPLDRLVVETDSPYLPPHPLRGTTNEPKNLTLIVDEIQKIKNISREELLNSLYTNSNRLFKL